MRLDDIGREHARVTAEEIRQASLAVTGTPFRERRVRPLTAALGGAAVTLLVIGVGALSLRGGGDVTSVPTPTQPPTFATDVPTTTIAPSPSTAVVTTIPASTTTSTSEGLTPLVDLNAVEEAVVGDNAWTLFTSGDGLCSDRIHEVAVETGGQVWAISNCGGVSRFDGQLWETIFEEPMSAGGTRGDRILSDVVPGGVYAQWFADIDAAVEGGVWIAVPFSIISFDGEQWIVTEIGETRDDPALVDLAVDGTGRPWAVIDDRPFPRSDEAGRLFQLDNGVWTPVPGSPEDGQAVAVGPDGVVWVAGNHGISAFDGTTWREVSHGFQAGIYSEQLAVDQTGTVWMIEFVGEGLESTNTLWSYDGERWARYEFGRLAGLIVDSSGVLWTAGDVGVLRFDGSGWSHYRYSTQVSSLAVDQDGSIWLGTTGGVLRLIPPGE